MPSDTIEIGSTSTFSTKTLVQAPAGKTSMSEQGANADRRENQPADHNDQDYQHKAKRRSAREGKAPDRFSDDISAGPRPSPTAASNPAPNEKKIIGKTRAQLFLLSKQKLIDQIEDLQRSLSAERDKVSREKRKCLQLSQKMLERAHQFAKPIKSDQQLHNRFETVDRHLSTWTKDWCREVVQPEEGLDAVMTSIHGKGNLSTSTLQAIRTTNPISMDWDIFMHMLLSDYVFSKIFLRPFAHLVLKDENGKLHDFEPAFSWAIDMASAGNNLPFRIVGGVLTSTGGPGADHKLRATIRRALEFPNPKDSASAASSSERFETMNTIHIAYCERVTIQFLTAYAPVLPQYYGKEGQRIEKSSYRALLKHIQDAFLLAADLASQNPHIKILNLNDIRNLPCETRHKYIEVHRASRLENVDDAEIEFVIVPAVIRAGKVDGDCYDQETIIKKAVVWFSPNPIHVSSQDESSEDELAGNIPPQASSNNVSHHFPPDKKKPQLLSHTGTTKDLRSKSVFPEGQSDAHHDPMRTPQKKDILDPLVQEASTTDAEAPLVAKFQNPRSRGISNLQHASGQCASETEADSLQGEPEAADAHITWPRSEEKPMPPAQVFSSQDSPFRPTSSDDSALLAESDMSGVVPETPGCKEDPETEDECLEDIMRPANTTAKGDPEEVRVLLTSENAIKRKRSSETIDDSFEDAPGHAETPSAKKCRTGSEEGRSHVEPAAYYQDTTNGMLAGINEAASMISETTTPEDCVEVGTARTEENSNINALSRDTTLGTEELKLSRHYIGAEETLGKAGTSGNPVDLET